MKALRFTSCVPVGGGGLKLGSTKIILIVCIQMESSLRKGNELFSCINRSMAIGDI